MAHPDTHSPEAIELAELVPSTRMDPRLSLPEEEREVSRKVLANGTVVTSYDDPPLASEYSAALPDPADYEALVDAVIAEFDSEQEEEARRLYGPWERNSLRDRMTAEEADPTEAETARWSRLR